MFLLNAKLLKKTSLFAIACASWVPMAALAFPDAETHWGKECISALGDRQLVTGYPDGTFRPDGTLTRAEFAVLMLNAFPNAPIKRGKVTFRDVPATHWANKAIQDAYQRAFFTGYPNRIFRPQQAIPRVQAIAVLSDALNGTAPSNANAIVRDYYRDAAKIPNYATGAIAAASLNSLVVNYPQVQQLEPNRSATRGEIAALLCRASSLYAVPPENIAGVRVRQQKILPLPGQLNRVPTFNSNSPELIKQGGILLSTFPGSDKDVPKAHLNYAFNGRFDIFSHHIARAETQGETRQPFYQGILVHNPGDRAVTVNILQGASYLGTPDAPFIDLPSEVENPNNTVYSGPGSRVAGEVLRSWRQGNLPETVNIPPGESRMLMNLPISIQRAPASNGRSTLMRLNSSGEVYVANLAMKGLRPPSLAQWENLLETGGLAGPRDSTPTPLDPPRHATVFGRVAGVSEGSQWTATVTDDDPGTAYLSLPAPGEAVSYALGTVHLITLTTQQVQSARMLARYGDTAYYAHSNYGIEYNVTIPLKNTSDRAQRVAIAFETPLKDEGGTNRLLFKNPIGQRPYFRGTLRVSYERDRGVVETRYVHVVQRRGHEGKPLVTLNLPPDTTREVKVDFIYPADVTPPQVLTVKTLGG
ncbi:MAG: DUF3370 family protein [Cyanobacteriota bacterium]|nr:DUF3370 family protein [Cyanobacteriota bacterium]